MLRYANDPLLAPTFWTLIIGCLCATGCSKENAVEDPERFATPLEAVFVVTAETSGTAYLSYRVTGDASPTPSASSIADDSHRNMDGAGNQCMMPLLPHEGYGNLRGAGVHFGTLSEFTGMPVGTFCNACVELSLGGVTHLVRLVDSLRNGQDLSDASGAIHFDLHAATYKSFNDVKPVNGKYIYGATWKLVRCREPASERRYALRHYEGGRWYQLQVRRGDVPIQSMQLMDNGGSVVQSNSFDHTGFFTFYLNEGSRYSVRLNGSDVRDIIDVPKQTAVTTDRYNGSWHASVVLGETFPLQSGGNVDPGGGVNPGSNDPPEPPADNPPSEPPVATGETDRDGKCYAYCPRGWSNDPEKDGWGWSDNASCIVKDSSQDLRKPCGTSDSDENPGNGN